MAHLSHPPENRKSAVNAERARFAALAYLGSGGVGAALLVAALLLSPGGEVLRGALTQPLERLTQTVAPAPLPESATQPPTPGPIELAQAAEGAAQPSGPGAAPAAIGSRVDVASSPEPPAAEPETSAVASGADDDNAAASTFGLVVVAPEPVVVEAEPAPAPAAVDLGSVAPPARAPEAVREPPVREPPVAAAPVMAPAVVSPAVHRVVPIAGGAPAVASRPGGPQSGVASIPPAAALLQPGPGARAQIVAQAPISQVNAAGARLSGGGGVASPASVSAALAVASRAGGQATAAQAGAASHAQAPIVSGGGAAAASKLGSAIALSAALQGPAGAQAQDAASASVKRPPTVSQQAAAGVGLQPVNSLHVSGRGSDVASQPSRGQYPSVVASVNRASAPPSVAVSTSRVHGALPSASAVYSASAGGHPFPSTGAAAPTAVVPGVRAAAPATVGVASIHGTRGTGGRGGSTPPLPAVHSAAAIVPPTGGLVAGAMGSAHVTGAAPHATSQGAAGGKSAGGAPHR